MKGFLVAAFLLIGTSAHAQQAVPDMPFDGDINFLKPPPDISLRPRVECRARPGIAARPTPNNLLVGDLLNWRMQVAMQKLRETRESVAQVAFAVGYESEAAFSRAFHREVGQPPSAWRRRRTEDA